MVDLFAPSRSFGDSYLTVGMEMRQGLSGPRTPAYRQESAFLEYNLSPILPPLRKA